MELELDNLSGTHDNERTLLEYWIQKLSLSNTKLSCHLIFTDIKVITYKRMCYNLLYEVNNNNFNALTILEFMNYT